LPLQEILEFLTARRAIRKNLAEILSAHVPIEHFGENIASERLPGQRRLAA